MSGLYPVLSGFGLADGFVKLCRFDNLRRVYAALGIALVDVAVFAALAVATAAAPWFPHNTHGAAFSEFLSWP